MHSDAYAAGELKHGTISLITDGVPVIALATQKQVYEKTISNAKETRSRGARVLLFTTKDNGEQKPYIIFRPGVGVQRMLWCRKAWQMP